MVPSFNALKGFCHLPGARERMRQSVALCSQGCLGDNGVPQHNDQACGLFSYFSHLPLRLSPRVWSRKPLLTASLQRRRKKRLTSQDVTSQTTAFMTPSNLHQPSDGCWIGKSLGIPKVPRQALLYIFWTPVLSSWCFCVYLLQESLSFTGAVPLCFPDMCPSLLF